MYTHDVYAHQNIKLYTKNSCIYCQLYLHEVENNNCSIKCSQGRHYSESLYIHMSTLNQQWLMQVV